MNVNRNHLLFNPVTIIFEPRSSKHHLRLTTRVHEGIQLTRLREDGVAVFEVSDPDLELELIVKKRKSPVLGGGKEGNKSNDSLQPRPPAFPMPFPPRCPFGCPIARIPLNVGGSISKHADTAEGKELSGGKVGDDLKSKSGARNRKRAVVSSCASAKNHKKQKNGAGAGAVVISRDEAEKKNDQIDTTSDSLKDDSIEIDEGEIKNNIMQQQMC